MDSDKQADIATDPENDDAQVDTELLARAIAETAWEVKARNVRVLDVRNLVSYTDYLIVCHGTSERHASAIARHIVDELRPLKYRPLGIEGVDGGTWALLDFGDAVVHVFHEPYRREYDIESIYSDAPRLKLDAPEELEDISGPAGVA